MADIAKRDVGLMSSSSINTVLVLLIIGAIVYYLFFRNKTTGAYQNEEVWEVEWDQKTMLPTKVTVHRDAVRS